MKVRIKLVRTAVIFCDFKIVLPGTPFMNKTFVRFYISEINQDSDHSQREDIGE